MEAVNTKSEMFVGNVLKEPIQLVAIVEYYNVPGLIKLANESLHDLLHANPSPASLTEALYESFEITGNTDTQQLVTKSAVRHLEDLLACDDFLALVGPNDWMMSILQELQSPSLASLKYTSHAHFHDLLVSYNSLEICEKCGNRSRGIIELLPETGSPSSLAATLVVRCDGCKTNRGFDMKRLSDCIHILQIQDLSPLHTLMKLRDWTRTIPVLRVSSTCVHVGTVIAAKMCCS